jgi:hypothetical protein
MEWPLPGAESGVVQQYIPSPSIILASRIYIILESLPSKGLVPTVTHITPKIMVFEEL